MCSNEPSPWDVLLSTHNICFGWEIRKLTFWSSLLTIGLKLKLSKNLELHVSCKCNELPTFPSWWSLLVFPLAGFSSSGSIFTLTFFTSVIRSPEDSFAVEVSAFSFFMGRSPLLVLSPVFSAPLVFSLDFSSLSLFSFLSLELLLQDKTFSTVETQ